MPTYDYRCTECGVFEKRQQIKDHARADCPTCGSDSKQILTKPPGLDVEAMADIGMPGAFETSGNRMTKRHRAAGQGHTGFNPE
jgi:putative FmdB family regulatory protein